MSAAVRSPVIASIARKLCLNPRGILHLPDSLTARYKKALSGIDSRSLSEDSRNVNSVLRSRGRASLKPPSYQATFSFSENIKARERHTNSLPTPTLEDSFNLIYGPREVAAYMTLRFPRVYSALNRVIGEVKRKLPQFSPQSMLDFGSGPASSILVAKDVWPRSIKEIIAIEPSTPMMEMAQKVLPDTKGVSWRKVLLDPTTNAGASGSGFDLVTSAYVLTEMTGETARRKAVMNLWNHTNDLLVLVEAGTPSGFEIIKSARQMILDTNEAYVVAPCPHDGQCPMQGADWCHFLSRVQRTQAQISAKRWANASLVDEKEKYSFVVLKRGARPKVDPLSVAAVSEALAETETVLNDDENGEEVLAEDIDAAEEEEVEVKPPKEDMKSKKMVALASLPWARLVRQPMKRSGHVIFSFCTAEGAIERRIATKSRNRGYYRLARKLRWGDSWPHPLDNLIKDGRGKSTEQTDPEDTPELSPNALRFRRKLESREIIYSDV